jgi:hypothetical protein
MNILQLRDYLDLLIAKGVPPTMPVCMVEENYQGDTITPIEITDAHFVVGSFQEDPSPKMPGACMSEGPMLLLTGWQQDVACHFEPQGYKKQSLPVPTPVKHSRWDACPSDDLIDDVIALWHSGLYPVGVPLRQALGWTEEEYSAWVQDAAKVPNRPLPIPPLPIPPLPWQPIESAPKDGTPILAYRANVGWEFFVVKWIEDRFFTLDSDLNPFSPELGGPTHWMPLPLPPMPEHPECLHRTKEKSIFDRLLELEQRLKRLGHEYAMACEARDNVCDYLDYADDWDEFHRWGRRTGRIPDAPIPEGDLDGEDEEGENEE